MIHKLVRAAAFAITATALCSIGHATDFRSDAVNIPFAFHVSTKALPAGDYRVAKNFDSQAAILTNIHTLESVQILLPNTSRNAKGDPILTFVSRKNGYKLRNY